MNMDNKTNNSPYKKIKAVYYVYSIFNLSPLIKIKLPARLDYRANSFYIFDCHLSVKR